MLAKQGIITDDEKKSIIDGLGAIKKEVERGSLQITGEYEDIHSFLESNLIKRIGDAGKKMHTGRSRNDQVALDMRLYTRLQVLETADRLYEMLETLQQIMAPCQEKFTGSQTAKRGNAGSGFCFVC